MAYCNQVTPKISGNWGYIWHERCRNGDLLGLDLRGMGSPKAWKWVSQY